MNIFIFHRDLRIEDNKGLFALAQEETEIYLVFILTKEQTSNNPLFNAKAFQALIFCLHQLQKRVHVNVLQAENEVAAIKEILQQGKKINKIYTNKDFSPYALKRSYQLKQLAREHKFLYREFYDYTLFNPHEITKPDGSFYQVFTPYWNAIWRNKTIPIVMPAAKFKALKMPQTFDTKQLVGNDFNLPLTRSKVELTVTRLAKDYQTNRDNIALFSTGTSHISTAIKYGVVSIREVHFTAC